MTNKVGSRYFAPEAHIYVCALGKKPSSAPFYVENRQGVDSLLDKLSMMTQQRKKTRSSANLIALITKPKGSLQPKIKKLASF
jgi:hypothetical protein